MADLGILGKIAERTRERISVEKALHPVEWLRTQPLYDHPPMSLIKALSRPGPQVIAEVKFTSPSEGVLRHDPSPIEAARIAAAYASAGASAVSILTEPEFFGGDPSFLAGARDSCPTTPLLMKDFVVDEYQFELARSIGADAVLLIAALLGPRLGPMHGAAKSLGLSVLIEVHNEAEAEAALAAGGTLIGVNSRDLTTLKVDLNVARRLAPLVCLPEITAVAESGLRSRSDLDSLSPLGYKAFLIGTSFMKLPDPASALKGFLRAH
ncbi:MAG: indole-3-glycerol phosphate synthase TrpC [Elusimicrobiota bacterium]|nr:indole-3-glycerol phosphate synthase TrpC [Elusimicrobiota bacterium]